MKKNIGSQLALYPIPVTVIGAIVLVSLAAQHFINGVIQKNQKLSINTVDEGILP